MTMSMLKSKDVPKIFWGKAVSTPVYILNRCPTKKMLDKTLYEARIGLKLNVCDFKVFGSI